jgi:7-carboxy-7-deazaguanine synthase
MIKQYQLTEKAHVIFSTSWEQLNPTDLANWILADQLPVRFQLQLHKILWADAKGH